MAIGTGLNSAGLEDLENERRKYEDDDSLAVGSAMKEDLKRERDKLKDGSTIVGSDD